MEQTALTLIASTLIFAAPAFAEPISIEDYLSSVDRTEVAFSGKIKYDRSQDDFTLYDDNRDHFGVTVDAGRDTRERIEKECESSGFMVSFSDLCTISGKGTVEIRGSRIYISIEHVDQLGR